MGEDLRKCEGVEHAREVFELAAWLLFCHSYPCQGGVDFPGGQNIRDIDRWIYMLLVTYSDATIISGCFTIVCTTFFKSFNPETLTGYS